MILINPLKSYFQDSYSEAITADEIIMNDNANIDTGIIDEYGNRIYRYITKEPVGFHHHHLGTI